MEKLSYASSCAHPPPFQSSLLLHAQLPHVELVAHENMDDIGGCIPGQVFILAFQITPKLVHLHQPWQTNHIHSSAAALMADNGVHFS